MRKFIFLFLCLSYLSVIPAVAAENFEELVLDIGHAQLTARAWGSPTAAGGIILALPGSGSDISRYKYVAPLVADAGFRFIAINQRGIMGSTGSLEDLDLHDYAADIVAVIEFLGVEKVHMVGWALGNRISRVVATDFPEKVATVSLIAAGGLVPTLNAPGELGRLLGEADISDSEKRGLARRTMFSPQTPESLVEEYVQELNYWPEARASQSRANRNTPREQWWAGGNSPMLIVQGLDDKTAPPENGNRIKEEYGDRIVLVNLENAGHAVGLERPSETAAAIIQFLQNHPI